MSNATERESGLTPLEQRCHASTLIELPASRSEDMDWDQMTSHAVQQADEDAQDWSYYPSRLRQQAHEDTIWTRLFKPLKSSLRPKKHAADIERGPDELSQYATSHQNDDVHHAAVHAAPLVAGRRPRKTSVTGIPLSHLASHHLPMNGGPLRARKERTDSSEDLVCPPAPTSETPSLLLDTPELSEHVRHDDAASQHRRAENLLRASRRVAKSAKDNLFYPIHERDDRSKTKKFVLNVATMRAAAIRYYQTMIVEYGAEMRSGGVYGEMPDVLHKYCDALRDMDYMHEKARLGFDHDPFLLMTTKQMEREMMLASGLITAHEMADGLPPALDQASPRLPSVGRTARHHATEARARTINLLCALLGGLALIVPMVIMTLVPSRACALVTTTSFVLGFALVIALLSGLKPNEVLAVTAGYAAVLVVFVGAQSGGAGSSIVA